MKQLLFLFIITSVFFSCKKNSEISPKNAWGNLTVYFENRVADENLILSDDYTEQWYLSPNQDSFTVSKYNYYITNMVFHSEDGTELSSKDFNFLIKADDEMTHFWEFSEVPLGTFTSVSFTLGVDSIYNVSGVHEGVFDPIHGMYWDWNTGYIMAKFEGNSPVSPAFNGMISIHLGGYKGRFSTIRKMHLDLPNALIISENQASEIVFMSDVIKWLEGEPYIDFSESYAIMDIGPEATAIADRYRNHISIKEINNNL